MKYGLKEAHLQAIQEVLKTNKKIEKAVLFGSRAMGTHTPESDVDICLFGDDLTLTDQAKLLADMEEMPMPQQVDLVLHSRIKEKKLLEHIEREGVVLVGETRFGQNIAEQAMRRTVGDYVTLQRGTTYNGMMVGQPGPALLGLGSIEPGGGFRDGHYKTYGGECPPNLMLVPGDLYVALKGATKDGKMIGSVARVPTTVPSGRLTQDTVKLEFRDDDAASHARYLYWLLRNPQYREYCAGHAMGSAVVALSRADFLAYSVPPLTPGRHSIVELLESIENKIELNRKMNETLESMARALFKSWFVDFDPVRAKAEGRAPAGMDAETAKLFPNEFEESELGLIPKGWRVHRLSELCTLGRGASPRPINDYMGGEIPWVKIADATAASGPFLFETKEKLKKEGIVKSITVSPGDLILSNSATCGVPIFVELSGCIHDGWLYFKNLRSISKLYLFHVLAELSEYLVHIADGSVQKNLNTNLVGHQYVLVPPIEVASEYDKQVMSWFGMLRHNSLESRTLIALRDTLLPRLLFGEISVTQAEHHVGANV